MILSIQHLFYYFLLYNVFGLNNLWLKILDWKETFSTFVWVFWVFTVLDSAISKSMSFYKDFTHKFTAINRMWEYFDGIPKIYWYDTWSDFVYKNWNIKFKNVSFWYSKNKSVFRNLDLKIAWWKITAFVWNSWGWKTTIVKIISQYIKQSSWNIFVDWQDLNSVSLKSYYKNIWYLTQEPSVFDWTVLENLTYSLDSRIPIDMKHIDEIINLSKCEFIYDLKNWINTEIWEKWIRLSWWQRQRLAIAKIMIKNPKIIILDEHTSALDSISEKLITKAMDNLFEGRTVLVIAHRLQTVKYAHEIIVINNWKIIERWNHKNLVEKKWVYNEMLELQSGF